MAVKEKNNMETVKNTKVNGSLVFKFLKYFNHNVYISNQYNKENQPYIKWNETVTKLNNMTDEQKTIIDVASKQAYKDYLKLLEDKVYPLLEEVINR